MADAVTETVRTQFVQIFRISLLFSAIYLCTISAGFANGGGAFPSPTTGDAPRVDRTAEFQGYYAKGLQFLKAGSYADAEKSLKRAVRIESRHGNARGYLGIAQVGLQDYKHARKNFEKAIKYDTDIPGVWQQLGAIYLNDGDIDSAKAQLAALEAMRNSCAAPCPNEVEIASAYNKLAKQIGEYEQSGGASQSHLLTPFDDETARQANRFYADAVADINRKDYARAIEMLDHLLALQPNDADALTYLGFSYRKLGHFETAKTYYDRALSINPDHAGANEYLGELYVQVGELGLAKAQLEKLDQICTFSCVEYEDLKRLIESKRNG